jgi:hypothetical protein
LFSCFSFFLSFLVVFFLSFHFRLIEHFRTGLHDLIQKPTRLWKIDLASFYEKYVNTDYKKLTPERFCC